MRSITFFLTFSLIAFLGCNNRCRKINTAMNTQNKCVVVSVQSPKLENEESFDQNSEKYWDAYEVALECIINHISKKGRVDEENPFLCISVKFARDYIGDLFESEKITVDLKKLPNMRILVTATIRADIIDSLATCVKNDHEMFKGFYKERKRNEKNNKRKQEKLYESE